jgi:hypothetical protein
VYFPWEQCSVDSPRGNFSWKLTGRAILVNNYCMSETAIANMWRGDPKKPRTIAFESEDAAHLRIDLDSLKKLTTQ